MATKTTAKTTAKKNPTYLVVKSFAYGMFALGLGLSVTHIFDLFHHTLGASLLTAAAVPIFVDGFQLVGRLIRGESFAESTRRTGLALQLFGAAISLAANVIAGYSIGDKIGGAIFVIGYILIEAIAEKIKPVQIDAAAATKSARSAAAAKAAATRKANAEKLAADAAAKAERRRMNREIKAIEEGRGFPVSATIPVSPAPIGTDAAYI